MHDDPVVHFNIAMAGKSDVWVPASNGTEPVTEIEGKKYQYCYNPALGKHAYYCLTDDLILIDDMVEALPRCIRY